MKKEKLIDAIGQIDDKYIKEAHEKKRFVFDWALTGKILTGVLCLVIVIGIIPNVFNFGMGKQAPRETEYSDTVTEAYSKEDISYGGVGGAGGIGYTVNAKVVTENKKLIVNGYINIETLDFDVLIEELNKNIDAIGAYIQNSSIQTNRYETRSFDATIRIPADKYNEFLESTKQLGNVTWYSENVDDVTEMYTDLKARLNSLKAEEEKVLEFYDKANSLSELMEVEGRLTDIRYEIDSIETRLKNYDLLTDYSTLNITIVETRSYTKTNDNFSSRLSLSFRNGFTNFINSIENFVIDVVYNIWSIIVVIVVAVIVILVIRKARKNRK